MIFLPNPLNENEKDLLIAAAVAAAFFILLLILKGIMAWLS